MKSSLEGKKSFSQNLLLSLRLLVCVITWLLLFFFFQPAPVSYFCLFCVMPAQSRLDKVLTELIATGTPQCLHVVLTPHLEQQQNVQRSLAQLAKKQFCSIAHATPEHAWEALSKKKTWILCPFGSCGDHELLRQAAVEVLCARTNDCCPQFRVMLLLESWQEFHAMPPIVRLLTGTQLGKARVLDLGDSTVEDPPIYQDEDGTFSDPGMHIVHPSLEEWLNYDHVEESSGGIATLQERIFHSDPELTVVKYESQYGKGGPYIRILRDALKFNVVTHTLDMTGSLCGDVVASCLVSILHTSRRLQTLRLAECSLTDFGMSQLSVALLKSESVRSVDLSRNPSLTDVSLMALASVFGSATSKTKIREICLAGNNSVYDVRQQWTPKGLNALWDALGMYGKLESLDVSNCGLTEEHLREASSRWLSRSAGSTPLPPAQRNVAEDEEEEEGLLSERASSHAPSSSAVEMPSSSSPPTDSAKALTKLSLAHNYFGDEVIATLLPKLVAIQELNLEHVQLTGPGYRAIGYALSEWKLPLQTLILDVNNGSLEPPLRMELLRDLPPALQSLMQDSTTFGPLFVVESLGGNQTLRKLSLSRSFMGDQAVMALCEMLIQRMCVVQDVDISGNCNVDEDSAHKIKELLIGGYFASNNSASTAGAAATVPLITAAPPSAAVTTKTAVVSSSSKSGGALVVAAAAVPPPPVIRALNLSSNTTGIGERALLALYQNRGLEELHVANMALVDAMLLPLAEGVKQNPEGLRIRVLSIGRNALHYQGVVNLAQHVEGNVYLEELSLASTWAAYDDEARRPTTLSLSREEGLYYLRPLLDVLQKNPSLKRLDLSDNDISVNCVRGIAAAIRHNRTLEVVKLHQNPLLTDGLIEELGEPRLELRTPL